jgi:hypothetical protein
MLRLRIALCCSCVMPSADRWPLESKTMAGGIRSARHRRSSFNGNAKPRGIPSAGSCALGRSVRSRKNLCAASCDAAESGYATRDCHFPARRMADAGATGGGRRGARRVQDGRPPVSVPIRRWPVPVRRWGRSARPAIPGAKGILAEDLAKDGRRAYLSGIDIWPDYRAVSPLQTAGRRFRSSPNIDDRAECRAFRAPSAQMHQRQSQRTSL